ncbi:hypothetical protein PTKIN_Ptkin14bG0195100 [Pterospermum kingtungense]
MNQKNLTPEVKGSTSLKLEDCEDLEFLADTTKEHMPTTGMFTNYLVNLVMKRMKGLKMLCNSQPPKGFLQNLETLQVEKCKDIVSLYPAAQNLKKLTVKDCKNLQEVFQINELLYREENQAMLLSNLVSLKLKSVTMLRWLLKGATQYVSLQNLKVVKIEKCNKLEYLFSLSLVQSLRLLKELDISHCDKLETIFELGNDDDQTESNKLLASAQSHDLPRLQKLQLCGLTNLSSFCPSNCFINAPALQYFAVLDCPRLTSFCIQRDNPLQSKLQGGYNFTSRVEVVQLDGLIWLHIWKAPIQVVLSNLRRLEVCNCNNLTSIFSVMLVRNLPQLSILAIRWCEKLEQIIVDDDEDETNINNDKETLIFPRLQLLWLEDLPSLTSFSPLGYHLLFPDLKKLGVTDCSQMITSFNVEALPVHAETEAPRLDDTCPSKPDIRWISNDYDAAADDEYDDNDGGDDEEYDDNDGDGGGGSGDDDE